jgi:phosphoribosylformylglycinamidine synthase
LRAVEAASRTHQVGSAGRRTFLAEVLVEPKEGVNDPQGEAIRGGLRSLGYDGVSRVRSGRYFQVTIDAPDLDSAVAAAESMCDRLLANPVIERFRVSVSELDLGIDASSQGRE